MLSRGKNLSDHPIISITMGDPSGIGPEIIIKALSDPKIYDICRPVVLGDAGALSANLRGLKKRPLNEISNPSEAKGRPEQIDLMALSELNRESIIPGKPTVEGGKAMVNYIISAVEMTKRKELSAIVTCPINKALMHEAGQPFEGHTQLIAHHTNMRTML